ncbi:MAG: Bug family tripartite tricarboxylate transporter substrate binding protein [Candidatus Binatia bacterium]
MRGKGKHMLIGLLTFLLVGGTFAGLGMAAGDYPAKTIKLIVPWAAGGGTDSLMRIVSKYAGDVLGQSVIVSNVKGASGTVGEREAKKAKPDGYTLFSAHQSVSTTYYCGTADINYWDFEPVALMTSTPSIVAAHRGTPWKTMKDLLNDPLAKGDKRGRAIVTFGATLCSTSHFFPVWIEKETKLKFRYVGYEGTAPRMAALLGKHISLAESNLAAKASYGERIRFLAIATEKRHPKIPDTPTLKELGIPVFFALARGWWAPKGTPLDRIKKVESALQKVAKNREFIKRINAMGTDVVFKGRKEYIKYIKETDKKMDELATYVGLNVRKKKK